MFPYSIQKHLKYIVEENVKFSVSNDASNKGNGKTYLIATQYFDCDNEIVNFILDFDENPSESSFSIYNEIKERLTKRNLGIHNLIAFSFSWQHHTDNLTHIYELKFFFLTVISFS